MALPDSVSIGIPAGSRLSARFNERLLVSNYHFRMLHTRLPAGYVAGDPWQLPRTRLLKKTSLHVSPGPSDVGIHLYLTGASHAATLPFKKCPPLKHIYNILFRTCFKVLIE